MKRQKTNLKKDKLLNALATVATYIIYNKSRLTVYVHCDKGVRQHFNTTAIKESFSLQFGRFKKTGPPFEKTDEAQQHNAIEEYRN